MRRFISVRLKLIATTVGLALLVVFVFGALTLRSVNDYVERETERLIEVRNETLADLGFSTARNLALPAASLMAEFDTVGLYGLVKPTVRGERDQGSDVVYAYIIGVDRQDRARLWMAYADADIRELYIGDGGPPILRAEAGEGEPELIEVEREGLAEVVSTVKETTSETVERRVILRDGGEATLDIQQFTTPIIDRTGALQGFLVLGYSRELITTELAAVRAEGEKKQQEMQRSILLIAVLSVVLGVIIAILQALGITRGITTLASVTRTIAGGDLSVRARIRSRDEIGQLGADFNTMADRIQELLVETREKASLEKELDIARLIQETLMPDAGMHTRGDTRFCGYFRSASICGGDFWNHSALNRDQLLLSVGDVTGHGVPSAMISAAAKSSLDTLKSVSKGQIELPYLLSELNKSIYEAARRQFVMTFLAVLIDPVQRKLHVANAGHGFPILLRQQPDGSWKARALVARGSRLGDIVDSTYTSKSFDLQSGDLLFLYSDGLTEYRDARGKEYTERRLRRRLLAIADLEPDAILESILADLEAFAGDAPQEDDITVVVARYQE